MPNMKIYADEKRSRGLIEAPDAFLANCRDLLCRVLRVPPSACQLALLSVRGLEDQPHVNIELSILPGADRSRALLESLAGEVRRLLLDLTGLEAAVRISQLDPETYVALK